MKTSRVGLLFEKGEVLRFRELGDSVVLDRDTDIVARIDEQNCWTSVCARHGHTDVVKRRRLRLDPEGDVFVRFEKESEVYNGDTSATTTPIIIDPKITAADLKVGEFVAARWIQPGEILDLKTDVLIDRYGDMERVLGIHGEKFTGIVNLAYPHSKAFRIGSGPLCVERLSARLSDVGRDCFKLHTFGIEPPVAGASATTSTESAQVVVAGAAPILADASVAVATAAMEPDDLTFKVGDVFRYASNQALPTLTGRSFKIVSISEGCRAITLKALDELKPTGMGYTETELLSRIKGGRLVRESPPAVATELDTTFKVGDIFDVTYDFNVDCKGHMYRVENVTSSFVQLRPLQGSDCTLTLTPEFMPRHIKEGKLVRWAGTVRDAEAATEAAQTDAAKPENMLSFKVGDFIKVTNKAFGSSRFGRLFRVDKIDDRFDYLVVRQVDGDDLMHLTISRMEEHAKYGRIAQLDPGTSAVTATATSDTNTTTQPLTQGDKNMTGTITYTSDPILNDASGESPSEGHLKHIIGGATSTMSIDLFVKVMTRKLARSAVKAGRPDLARTLISKDARDFAKFVTPAALLGIAIVGSESEHEGFRATCVAAIPALKAATSAGLASVGMMVVERFLFDESDELAELEVMISGAQELDRIKAGQTAAAAAAVKTL